MRTLLKKFPLFLLHLHGLNGLLVGIIEQKKGCNKLNGELGDPKLTFSSYVEEFFVFKFDLHVNEQTETKYFERGILLC